MCERLCSAAQLGVDSQWVQHCERRFHYSFDPILISKISLNGALNSLHSFIFSLNKVLLYIVFAGTQEAGLSKDYYCMWNMILFPKFPKWLFFYGGRRFRREKAIY